jgi:MFS family permease
MTLHGVVQNFGGLLAVRVLLGLFESGFYPGAIYLCSSWYMPTDLASRIAWFYCSSSMSGAFSGLLAAAIAQMDGVGGYEGWRWIFLLEGILTVVLGISCSFLLIDSPSLSGRWLTPSEIRFLNLQTFIKQGGRFQDESHDKKINWHDLKMVVTNWRLYMQAYALLATSSCSYGMKFTLPSIIKAMNFTNTTAQLMTVPVYIGGAVASIFFSFLSDHFQWRMPFVVIPMMLITMGYSVIISLGGDLTGSNLGGGYFALIMCAMGTYSVQPTGGSWAANNLAPSSRRAVGVAFNICVGNIGGIIGSYMYFEKDAPQYWTGYGISLALGGVGVIVALLLELSYKVGNDRKAQLTEEEVRSMYSEDELLRMGDKSPLFKYTL